MCQVTFKYFNCQFPIFSTHTKFFVMSHVTPHYLQLAEPKFGRAKRIRVWINGEVLNPCFEVTINPNILRTWNAVLNHLTKTLDPSFGAVRRLVCLSTRKTITCFEELDPVERYVILGTNCRLKSTKGYRTLSEFELNKPKKKPQHRFYSGEIDPLKAEFLVETSRRGLTIVFVFVNGQICYGPVKVVLNEKDLINWDITLQYLSKILDVPDGIEKLCTIFGDILLCPEELQHGYAYVALPFNEKFVKVDYMSAFGKLNNKTSFTSKIRPSTSNKNNSKKSLIPRPKKPKKYKKSIPDTDGIKDTEEDGELMVQKKQIIVDDNGMKVAEENDKVTEKNLDDTSGTKGSIIIGWKLSGDKTREKSNISEDSTRTKDSLDVEQDEKKEIEAPVTTDTMIETIHETQNAENQTVSLSESRTSKEEEIYEKTKDMGSVSQTTDTQDENREKIRSGTISIQSNVMSNAVNKTDEEEKNESVETVIKLIEERLENECESLREVSAKSIQLDNEENISILEPEILQVNDKVEAREPETDRQIDIAQPVENTPRTSNHDTLFVNIKVRELKKREEAIPKKLEYQLKVDVPKSVKQIEADQLGGSETAVPTQLDNQHQNDPAERWNFDRKPRFSGAKLEKDSTKNEFEVTDSDKLSDGLKTEGSSHKTDLKASTYSHSQSVPVDEKKSIVIIEAPFARKYSLETTKRDSLDKNRKRIHSTIKDKSDETVASDIMRFSKKYSTDEYVGKKVCRPITPPVREENGISAALSEMNVQKRRTSIHIRNRTDIKICGCSKRGKYRSYQYYRNGSEKSSTSISESVCSTSDSDKREHNIQRCCFCYCKGKPRRFRNSSHSPNVSTKSKRHVSEEISGHNETVERNDHTEDYEEETADNTNHLFNCKNFSQETSPNDRSRQSYVLTMGITKRKDTKEIEVDPDNQEIPSRDNNDLIDEDQNNLRIGSEENADSLLLCAAVEKYVCLGMINQVKSCPNSCAKNLP